MAFLRLQKGNVCPICQHPRSRWCGVSEDKKVARCMRIKSEKESQGSDGTIGWIHELNGHVQFELAPPKEPIPKLGIREVTEIAKHAYQHDGALATRQRLGEELGVSLESLDLLRVGYGCDHSGEEYSSWPSRNPKGQVVGITRRYLDGRKKSYPGTTNGLFFSIDRSSLGGPLLVVEGGSDVAAAATVSLLAIGRPSNTGGINYLARVVKGTDRSVIVIGENDLDESRRGEIDACPLDCDGCGRCFPGLFGAKLVSERLNVPFVMPPAEAKDFRELVDKGHGWLEILKHCR
jgi:hypothetical protein